MSDIDDRDGRHNDDHDNYADRDALAAEYVLGALDADERAQAQTLIAVDEEFAASVTRWERRLGELHVMVEPVEPPEEVWQRILSAIVPDDAAPIPAAAVAALQEPNAEMTAVYERFQRWRRIGIAACFVATSLAVVMVLRDAPGAPEPKLIAPAASDRYVAALQRDAAAPAFLLTVDLDRRTMTVRRVAAEGRPGKSYELWLVSSRFPAPRSLGVIGVEEFTVRRALEPYDAATVREATYAISLEPEGGSPTGVATGPILYIGKLVEAAPGPSS